MPIPPIAAEPIAHIINIPITNAMINAWIATLFFIVIGTIVGKKQAMIPRGMQNAFEMMTEFFLRTIESVTHDEKRARKFLPVVGTLFLFILVSNWMGLLPGTGSIGVFSQIHGEMEFIPLFRPAASDLNFTLGLAVFSVVGANIFGITAIGFFKHLNKFFPLGTMVAMFRKGGINIFVGFVEFFVGIVEFISEIAKMVSLSLRLFGNVFAGEVLLTVIASLLAYVVPLPFMGLELLVGVIQAMVFSLLALVYLTVATEPVQSGDH